MRIRFMPFVVLGLFLARRTPAQSSGSIRGTIVFEAGAPRIGSVMTRADGIREAKVDSLGRFRLVGVPPGSVDVEAICDNGSSFARPIAFRKTVAVVANRESEISVTLTRASCDPIPERDMHVHWRGRYAFGFELSSFVPCPTDSLARELRGYGHPFGRSAWVGHSRNEWVKDGVGQLKSDAKSAEHSGFVEWSGTLHGPAPSGHMGSSNYELTVDSIFSVEPSGHC